MIADLHEYLIRQGFQTKHIFLAKETTGNVLNVLKAQEDLLTEEVRKEIAAFDYTIKILS